jgi:hypothetical protein
MAPWATETDADIRVAWSPRGNPAQVALLRVVTVQSHSSSGALSYGQPITGVQHVFELRMLPCSCVGIATIGIEIECVARSIKVELFPRRC